MTSTRRALLKYLFAAPLPAAQNETGASLVMRLSDRKLLYTDNSKFAAGALLPPASTIKPFAVLALLERGKLRAEDQFFCSRHLVINGHSLNCIHPQTALPMNPARALAYSCNGAIAHFAARFAADEFPQALIRYGFTSQPGLLPGSEAAGILRRNTIGAVCELQALGEEGIVVTPLELLLAYARLSKRLADPRYSSIREGLEGAVEFGTAQAAKIPGVKVAGKTGSIILRSGSPGAWFAGFSPQLAVVVFTAGRSGGGDAAPLAAELFKKYGSAG